MMGYAKRTDSDRAVAVPDSVRSASGPPRSTRPKREDSVQQEPTDLDAGETVTIATGEGETVRRDLEDWHELSIPTQRASWSTSSLIKAGLDAVLRPFGYRLSRIPGKESWSNSHSYYEESHHKSYGRPWCLGRDHFDYLVSRGLRPSDNFLDLGCGALRTGIFVIPYLEPGRYYGVEAHRLSLEAAANYEIPLNKLAHKNPRLLHSSTFDLAHWNVTFDWIFAFSLFKLNHVDLALQGVAFRRMSETLAKDGTIVLSPPLVDRQIELIESVGFKIGHRETRPSKLLDDKIEWMEITRR